MVRSLADRTFQLSGGQVPEREPGLLPLAELAAVLLEGLALRLDLREVRTFSFETLVLCPLVLEAFCLLLLASLGLRRRMNNELNFPPDFEGLVLGCIDADFCK